MYNYPMTAIRILFLSDTHLGFDLPFRPRIQRRRRGPEFFSNFQQALEDAISIKVDAIIHGGDLFYRSRVPQRLVEMVFEPLKKVAEKGIPIFIVPGNHERSFIPHSEFSFHPNLHIFTHPKTFQLQIGDHHLTISGFPSIRDNIRDKFTKAIKQTNWHRHDAHARLLCIHQTVEGAKVGPVGYTFRRGSDVIRGEDIPSHFSAILSGHIHRFQVLRNDLKGRPIQSPVFYPGATDRVSFAERDEEKGYLVLKFILSVPPILPRLTWQFKTLPTRPMKIIDFRIGSRSKEQIILSLN
jgi:DNA repair exonuclease SbcCD nuclease subunit